jgi:hypothetical protein
VIVIVGPPLLDLDLRILQRGEPDLVQALLPEPVAYNLNLYGGGCRLAEGKGDISLGIILLPFALLLGKRRTRRS